MVAPFQMCDWRVSGIDPGSTYLPAERPVTILVTYQVRSGGLDGRRFGGLKCFASHLDERLVELDKEWRTRSAYVGSLDALFLKLL